MGNIFSKWGKDKQNDPKVPKKPKKEDGIDLKATFKNNINGDTGESVAVGKKKVIFRTLENWLENYEAIKTHTHIKLNGRVRYNSVIVKNFRKTAELRDDLFGKPMTMKMLRPNGTFRVVNLKADPNMKILMPVNINITINSIIINLDNLRKNGIKNILDNDRV